MTLNHFSKKTYFHQAPGELYNWHTRPGAFARLTPPWIKLQLLTEHPGILENAKVCFKTSLGPFFVTWLICHKNVQLRSQFVDVLLKGPLKTWRHEHIFHALPLGTQYEDNIHYELPCSLLLNPLLSNTIQRFLHRMFLYRHEILYKDLTLPWIKRFDATPRHILIVGGTGFIGKSLVAFLQTQGHRVSILSRSSRVIASVERIIQWDPIAKRIPLDALEGIDAVINLAGEPIAQRWDNEVKNKIWQSRVQLTQFLCETLCKLKNPPPVFIQASGIGYYGARRLSEELAEDSKRGKGFLAELSEVWENATDSLSSKGIRIVKLRLPAVLSPEGGALQKLLISYKIGFCGCWRPASNRMPWVSRDDLLDAIYFSILNTEAHGIFNVVAPHIPTNAEFADIFANARQAKLRLRVPASFINIILGEMAEELFKINLQVSASKLINHGFQFRYPKLQDFVKHLHFEC